VQGLARATTLLGAALALAIGLTTSVAGAQEAPPAPAPADDEGNDESAPQPNEAETDKLVQELLTSEGVPEDDDLRWLYSDLEEYSPSGLVGEPIEARGLPQRGEGAPRKWDPRWRKFGLGNYILTGVGLAIAGGSSVIPAPGNPWTSHVGFDESVRDVLGIEDREAGQWARDVSDVLMSISLSYPLLVDSLVVTYWYRRSHGVAGQMALITAETIAVAGAIHGLTAGLTGRERPYGRNCGTSIDADQDDCTQDRRYRSFFSGHTALTFAAAGVTCSHHAHHDPFGDPVADGIACASAFFAAGLTGAMRIVGDEHYATDVAMGATIGTLTGLGVPWLLHYGPLAEVQSETEQASVVRFAVVPAPNGVGVGGAF
jgi:hypothetical protein